jgi:hypothetical protein
LLLGAERFELVDDDFHQVVDAVGLEFIDHPARFQLREVEQVVHQPQERLGALADVLKELLQFFAIAVGGFVLTEAGIAQDAVQRGAELVGDIGQEFALGPIGRVGRVALLLDDLGERQQLRLCDQQGMADGTIASSRLVLIPVASNLAFSGDDCGSRRAMAAADAL